jgi:hypothetical protein
MNQMPQMPGMPSPEPQIQDSAPVASTPTDLSIPTHSEPQVRPPVIIKDAGESDSEVKVMIPKEGIEVVATRKGFYNQNRYEPSDRFFVTSFEHLGEWMECVDKVFEKKRIEALKIKKAKARK